MTLNGGTSQACAACKYQRRKCKADCPLAPYFPPDQPELFLNAHDLFGVRNILNILKKLDDDQKSDAMRSIIYQSNTRNRFPFNGCLAMHRRYQFEQNRSSQLELGMGQPTNQSAPNEADYNNICFYFGDSFANPSRVSHPVADNILFPVQDEVENYDEMLPFFDTMDDYVDSNESSSEESRKDSTLLMEHVADNHLKFDLTNSERRSTETEQPGTRDSTRAI